MLICKRDVALVIVRVVLDTWPLLSLAGHCLMSGYALTGALLAAAPVTDISAKSFSSVILCATPVSA